MALIEQIEKQLTMLPLEKQNEVLDFILFLRQRLQATPASTEEERGKRIKAAFRTLSELNTFADVTDPVAWQKQIRQDRQLPGRPG
ncbi:hypothetical protein [Candidatus Leptofilum sp.]|uniref:hypothetical protein n=1 Tax=Candidatus Leptofilum sp. TaxID=3241576 RepID=UPI003B5C6D07